MTRLFGEYLKQLRTQRNSNLRAFCSENGLDPGNYSKLERGILPPPSDPKKLEIYRSALSLSSGSEEWSELRRLSAFARGEIPPEILNNPALEGRISALFKKLESATVLEIEAFLI